MTDDQVGRILAALDQVRGEISELRASTNQTRVDLMDRMDRLQDGLSAWREDVTVNYGRADRVERIAGAGIEAVRIEVRALAEELSGVHRQIQRLQSQVRELRGDP